MEEKERLAYHEAGHAVASVRYGRKFLNITIRSDAEYRGCLKGLEELKDRRKEVIVRLAGFAADVKWSPKTGSVARKGVESDDFSEAKYNMQLIQDLSPEESDLEHWISQAGKFVDENWKAIGSVAWELEKRETLTSQEVESVIEKSDRREKEKIEGNENLRQAERRIFDHPGYKEYLELNVLNLSISGVFIPNYQDLLTLLEAASTNPFLAGELVQNIRKPDIREQFDFNLTRRLHNYLASLTSLIDHVRRLMQGREGPIAEEFERRKQQLLQNSEAQFMVDLRNFIVHRRIPFFVHRMGLKAGRLDSEVELDISELLEWENWTAPARTYLKAQEKAVVLRPIIEKHGLLVYELNSWLFFELAKANSHALKEVNEFVEARNLILRNGPQMSAESFSEK